MKKTHSEFAYQARELGIQIEDTLGDPPDRKYHAKVVRSLLDEFAGNSAIDDVNLLAFALADQLSFLDPAGLLGESAQYDGGDIERVLAMVSCGDEKAARALVNVAGTNPELARRAIITVFLYKHPKRWSDEDQSLDALQKSEGGDEEDEDQPMQGYGIDHLFDADGENHD